MRSRLLESEMYNRVGIDWGEWGLGRDGCYGIRKLLLVPSSIVS